MRHPCLVRIGGLRRGSVGQSELLADGDLDRLVRGEETGLHEQSQRRGGRILARTDLVEHDPRRERVAAEVQID
ncbi:hypothetical protein GS931_24040 [Rhodococcus hoagii]|nr:hypothetical protein [Prescottella equi]